MSNPIISILIIILSLGFSVFYVKPEYDTTQKRTVDVATLDKTLKDAGEIELLINDTEKTLNGIDPTELSRFMVFLPETTDSLRLANNIQHIGTTHGITIDQLKVDDNAKKSQTGSGTQDLVADIAAREATPKYTTVTTTFTTISNDETFRAFLGDLEKNLGLMNIVSLTFTPAVAGTDGKPLRASFAPLYQYTVVLETYSLK